LGVASLRDVSPEQFAASEHLLADPVRRRARHVITENDRVERFVEASTAGNLERMGELLAASHRSLQHDYEVSCEELDFLVDTALGIEGVYGSRMTGGGFGGCTVTMLAAGSGDHFRQEITAAYKAKFGVTPAIYSCKPSDGAGEAKKVENFRSEKH